MEKLQKDIENAIKLIKRRFYLSDEFGKYSSIYAFTNENINSYFHRINITDKSILTVASSGDYIFDAYLRGASNIESFDINILTKYYISLKQAAIKTLEYDEFISFFCLDCNYFDIFNQKTYQKIRTQLSEENTIFWDSLYHKYNGNKTRKSHLFFSDEEIFEFLKHAVLYLQPENYMNLKEKLIIQDAFSEKNFKNINVKNIQDNYEKQFDIILISNIADYIHEIYPTTPIENFKKWLEHDVQKILGENGIICVAYIFWHYFEKRKDIPLINQKHIRDQYFKDLYEEWLIDNSHIENTTDDKILIYKKK